MLNGFGFAWGKPVPVNPHYFKSPRWDSLKVSIAGPTSNIMTAVVLAVVNGFVVTKIAPDFTRLLDVCILFNLVLAFFNMIPVAPLDGSKVLSSLLPVDLARRYEFAMGRYGLFILLAILFTGIAGLIIVPPVTAIYRLLLMIG
jgi:Zn-dependent protease